MPININKVIEVLNTLQKYHKYIAKIPCVEYNPMEEFVHYVTPKEIVHSKIISDLLRPNGQHEMGDIFLKAFLNKISWNIDSSKDVEIKTEYRINGEHKDNRRIDILIKINHPTKRAIIIENKLNGADYQPHQIEDYLYGIKKENYNDENIKIVCLHLEEKNENGPICYLTPGDLSKLIKDTLEQNTKKQKNTPFIIAYSRYLENLNIYNRTMNYSRLLANINKISDEQFNICKAIYQAFNKLPDVFADNLLEKLKNDKNSRYEDAEKEENYEEYVAVWSKQMWNNNQNYDCWLSVGFNINEVYFYLVGYNEVLYANKCDFSFFSKQKERIWYRPNNEDEWILRFNTRPNYDEILTRINTFIGRIETGRNLAIKN